MSLNRRHFLKLMGAAGALGTAGFAPALLGRGGRAIAQDAMMGQIVQIQQGALRLHTYIAPAASAVVTSHVIETPNKLVVVDAQLVQTFGREFRAYVDSIGKPIDRVILSHEHPDHWAGANLFADVPFESTATIAQNVQANIDGGGVANLVGMIGESEVPSEPRAPEGTLTAGELDIDGVTFAVDVIGAAEAPEQLVIRLPEFGVMILQDLLYNNVYFFPGLDRAGWLTALEDLRALTDYNVLLVGHGLPTTRGELDFGIEYLNFVQETVASAESGEAVADALRARYPSFGGDFLLSFWPQFFGS
jgi:glyoxylase-like metal-dependent hydrolase (beta-lactamase superfamily II)